MVHYRIHNIRPQTGLHPVPDEFSPSHLRLDLPSGLFPTGFPTKPSIQSSSSSPPPPPCVLHRLLTHIPWIDHSNYVRPSVWLLKLLTAIFASLLLFHSLWFTYSPQSPVLKYPEIYVRPLTLRGQVSHPYKTTAKNIIAYNEHINVCTNSYISVLEEFPCPHKSHNGRWYLDPNQKTFFILRKHKLVTEMTTSL
jgi:hypothetical protein